MYHEHTYQLSLDSLCKSNLYDTLITFVLEGIINALRRAHTDRLSACARFYSGYFVGVLGAHLTKLCTFIFQFFVRLQA